MENVFEEIGHGVKVAAEDTAHIVKEAVLFPAKAIAVVDTCISDYPELKPVFTQLVTEGSTIAGDVAKDYSEKGLDLADDEATLSAVKAFFTYFTGTVIPAIEKVYGQLNADVSTPAAAAPAAPTA